MRLVVLDTNVIISAGIKPQGFPARIVHAAIQPAKIQIVVSPTIIAEYRRVSQYSKFAQYGFPPLWLEFLIEEALKVQDVGTWPHRLPDPDDACFLSLAQATGAWLVTGNLKHYPVELRENVVVCSPADYMAKLDESS